MTTDVKTRDERIIVEQSSASVVVSSSEQIVAVIEQLHVCYDYCAVWKDAPLENDGAEHEEHRADAEQSPEGATETKR
jgi:hypothetical protein